MGRSAYHFRRAALAAPARRLLAGVVGWALLAAQGQALPAPNLHPAATTAALAVCAAERAPLVELQQEYAGVRRAKLSNAFSSGAKAGVTMLLESNPLFSLASSAAKHTSMMGGQSRGASNPNDPDNAMLNEALSLKIPGVEAPPPPPPKDSSGKMTQLAHMAQPSQAVNDNSARTLLAISMVAAIGGSTDVYIRVKQQQYSNDAARIAQSIESDAGSQVPVGAQAGAQLKALTDCRQKQVAEFKGKVAAASDKDKKALLKTQPGLKSAVAADLALSTDLATQQATVARVLTQARAMAENKSEADVLNPQAPAYSATASTLVWQLPPLANPLGMAGGSGGPKATYVAIRNTSLRAAPDPKAKLVMSLAAGHSLTPTRRAAADAAWWEVDVAGTPAYVRGADLAEPGSAEAAAAASKGKGKGRGKGAGPAREPPPSNIRALNGRTIAVRTVGSDPLKTLVDGLEAAAS